MWYTLDGCRLYAPESYVEATAEQRARVSNGCGGRDWTGLLVPNFMWGLNCAPICDIHDWMYEEGEDIEAKVFADRVYINNLHRWIWHNTKGRFALVLRILRLRRARTYWQAVVEFGGPAFWASLDQESS